jgi:hypothetical protein
VATDKDRLLTRISELEAALRAARSDDLRATIREAIADCERACAALERVRPGGSAEVAPQSG